MKDLVPMHNTAVTPSHFTLESALAEWISTVEVTHSHSLRTKQSYEETITAFRAFLQAQGYDLNSDPVEITRIATIWASLRNANTRRPGQPVSPSTYNQRLAILSSFYSFLKNQYKLDIPNPIENIKRPKVQAYAAAVPLDENQLGESLETINRESPEELRDYAIIAVALYTGRRASELVGLRWRDVQITGGKKDKRVTLTFHCKGNKIKRDTLDQENTAVLLEYLHAAYGKNLMQLEPESPIWVSYSRRNYGQAIGHDTLRRICETYLATGKTHALRHTFAVGMMNSGAPITELGDRLGHTDIKITQIYTRELRGADNPYGERLTSRFGIRRKASKR